MKANEASFLQTRSILDACGQLLQKNRQLEASSPVITTTFTAVGQAINVDRIYLFSIEHRETEYASHVCEWTTERVTPQIDNPELQNIPLREAGYTRWLEEMQQYRPVVGPIKSFPQSEQPMLEMQGILSLLILPVFSDGALWGFVGFDDCTEERVWSSTDVDVLIALTMALGIALSRGTRRSAEDATSLYLRLVGRLLDVHTVMFSETSPVTLWKRAEVRMRIVARSYQHFVRTEEADAVNHDRVEMVPYMAMLHPFLEELLAGEQKGSRAVLSGAVGECTLTIKRALDVAIITGEVLAAFAEHRSSGAAGAELLVSLQRRAESVSLTITARSASGEPLGRSEVLDGMAVSLLRDIQQHVDGSVAQHLVDGMLLRVTFNP